MADAIRTNVATEYVDYLRDESRMTGAADSISFPTSEDELRETLRSMARLGIPTTIQGGRTGITGGCVPHGGHVLNLTRLNRITGLRHEAPSGGFLVTVQPGLLLADLRKALAAATFDISGWSAESLAAVEHFKASGPWIFPPDPTETSASLGGMIACNASGARSFRYGPTRSHVRRIRVVLADGALLDLQRSTPFAPAPTSHAATGRAFSLVTDGGRLIAGALPSYNMPSVKNAAGYYARNNMDLLDMFIGSEGTLGVLSEAELQLIPAPGACWGLVAFLPSEDAAVRFVEAVRCRARRAGSAGVVADLVAIEYFDAAALALLRSAKETVPAFADLPTIPSGEFFAVYLEFEGRDDDSVTAAVEAVTGDMTDAGCDTEATWIAATAKEVDRLKNFRHAVPEAVNLLIDERKKAAAGVTKLGTDMSVPDAALRRLLSLYREALSEARLEHVVFGHIGDNHLHVNVLPRNAAEYDRGKTLYREWARWVVQNGGSVSAEHGIGKLKTDLLGEMFGADGIRQMRSLKAALDPQNLLNRGNLFPA